MTTAIEFLEAMGRSAAPPAGADFEAAVAGLGIDTAQRQALLVRDTAALARLLRGRPAMVCMVMTPESEDADDAPERTPDEDDGRDDRPPGDDAPERQRD